MLTATVQLVMQPGSNNTSDLTNCRSNNHIQHCSSCSRIINIINKIKMPCKGGCICECGGSIKKFLMEESVDNGEINPQQAMVMLEYYRNYDRRNHHDLFVVHNVLEFNKS